MHENFRNCYSRIFEKVKGKKKLTSDERMIRDSEAYQKFVKNSSIVNNFETHC